MSSPVVEIRPATTADALAIVLRATDLAEAEAWSNDPPAVTITDSIEHSAEAWAGLANGELVTLFGVAPLTLIGVTGVPWMVASPAIERHQRAFLRRNRAMVDHWQKSFPILRNFVDARNTTSQRWLRWLGFEIGAPVPYGVTGLPFHPFERIA